MQNGYTFAFDSLVGITNSVGLVEGLPTLKGTGSQGVRPSKRRACGSDTHRSVAINTLGILEIIYLFFFAKKRFDTLFSK